MVYMVVMKRKRFFVVRWLVFVMVLVAVGTGFVWGHQIEDFVNEGVLGNTRQDGGPVKFDGGMVVHFIDVGQGDAAVIEFPGGERMLVDAGRWNITQNAFRRYLDEQIFNGGDWVFDWFIATHSHADHIGDGAHVLSHASVRNVVRPLTFTANEFNTHEYERWGLSRPVTVHHASGSTQSNPSASPATFNNFISAMNNATWTDGSPTNVYIPRRGKQFHVGAGATRATVTFYSPTRPYYGTGNINHYSTIFCVYFNGRRIMFTGDAYVKNENYALNPSTIPTVGNPWNRYLSLALPSNIDILDLGHHGSNTSNGAAFLSHVNPSYAIIQVGTPGTVAQGGTGNSYGHPHNVVLNRLPANTTIWRTDQDGDIVIKISADGDALEVGGVISPPPFWVAYWMMAIVVVVISSALIIPDFVGKKSNASTPRNNNTRNNSNRRGSTARRR